MRRSLFSIALAASIVTAAGTALAHEDTVRDDLRVTVGWANEPAYAGYANGVQLVAEHDGVPVRRARLTVVVSFSEQATELRLAPVPGRPGEFSAPIVPTRAGTYTFAFRGRIDGERFDEEFTSGPSSFDDVGDPGEIEFPVADPSRGDLAARAERLDARVAETARVAAAVGDDAETARTLGIVGIILGVVAIAGVFLRVKVTAD